MTDNPAVARAIEQLGGVTSAAVKTGIPKGNLSFWKNGKRCIPEPRARQLADAAYGALLDDAEYSAMLRGNKRVQASWLLEKAAKLLAEAGNV